MNDTSQAIADIVRAKLLARPGAERVLMGSQMFDAARAMVLASLPGGLSEIEIKGRLCERLYGSEVKVDAFLEHLRSLSTRNPTPTIALDIPPKEISDE
jgi:hypothetical protein